MAKTHFLKQGEGRTVKQPDGQPWPADGMEVEETLFIRRRIKDGDLVAATPPTSAPTEDTTETAKRGRKFTAEPATGDADGDAK